MYDYHDYYSILSLDEGDDSNLYKKISLLAIAFLLLFGGAAQAVQAKEQSRIRVYLDGQEIKFQAPPIMKNGVTYVQFRPLFQALNYSVGWDGAKKQITGTYIDQKLQMTLGQSAAYVNSVKSKLPGAPFTQGGNTLVPLRFVAEATGLPVKWDAKARTIKIDRQGPTAKAKADIEKLYRTLDAAENAKDLAKAKTVYHPQSPLLSGLDEYYKDQFQFDLNVSSEVSDVMLAGTTAEAFVATTVQRVSGPFTWDSTIYSYNYFKKDASGVWKLAFPGEYEQEYNVSDEFLASRANVPEAELKAIQDVIDIQYKGFNTENGPLLMSVIHPNSEYYELFQSSIADGIFDELNFNLKAEVTHPLFYDGEDAVLYIEESDDADGDMISTTYLYWLTKSEGKWMIYDVLELE